MKKKIHARSISISKAKQRPYKPATFYGILFSFHPSPLTYRSKSSNIGFKLTITKATNLCKSLCIHDLHKRSNEMR